MTVQAYSLHLRFNGGKEITIQAAGDESVAALKKRLNV